MFDRYVRPPLAAPLEKGAGKISTAGFSSGHVTLLSLLLGVTAMFCAGMAVYVPAFILILLSMALSVLADEIARATPRTAVGRYVAFVAGPILLAGYIMFFGLSVMQGTGASVLLFAYFMLIALKTPEGDSTPRPAYHLASLVEGGETIIFLALITLYPSAFTAIAAMFATLCFLSALGHAWLSVRAMR